MFVLLCYSNMFHSRTISYTWWNQIQSKCCNDLLLFKQLTLFLMVTKSQSVTKMVRVQKTPER